ncbi:helix-turn-helix domain-containing protein [Streptomyces sp. NBC_01411]|uniref:helix-turn-helix domain-containing protein n=1 Tax=Streptomyces sp. NBC_01411 TaxID=2903857 RepID=UPI00386B1F33
MEASAPGPSRYLREVDRIHIADRLREKASIRTIAAELGRSPPTISREIHRNGAMWPTAAPNSAGPVPSTGRWARTANCARAHHAPPGPQQAR